MPAVNVSLPDEQYVELVNETSDDRGKSEVIQEALDQYFAEA